MTLEQFAEKNGWRPTEFYECSEAWGGCGQMYYPLDTAPALCICGAAKGVAPYWLVYTYDDVFLKLWKHAP